MQHAYIATRMKIYHHDMYTDYDDIHLYHAAPSRRPALKLGLCIHSRFEAEDAPEGVMSTISDNHDVFHLRPS